MTQIRASENKKAHSGGAQAFVLRAHDLKQKGDQVPHLTTYVEVYKKYDPDHVAAVQSTRTAELEKMMADLPPIDEVSNGTSPASAPTLVLSYETQVSVLERAVGPSRGTRVRGLRSGSAKLPRKRGPSSQTDSDTSMELVAEVAQLRANQVAIHEQLQRERAERETERAERERERDRERERAEQERERVDFEHKLQAQIEYVIRAAGIQPSIPLSDGYSPLPRLIKMAVEVTFSTSQSAINHIAKTKTNTTIPQGLTLSPFFNGLQPGVDIKHYIAEVKNHGSQHAYS
ncbi:hypothetical protein LguiB_026643 [Lonicera macranthoides]